MRCPRALTGCLAEIDLSAAFQVAAAQEPSLRLRERTIVAAELEVVGGRVWISIAAREDAAVLGHVLAVIVEHVEETGVGLARSGELMIVVPIAEDLPAPASHGAVHGPGDANGQALCDFKY